VRPYAYRVLRSGALASLASAAAALLCSRIENRHAAQPMNAVAHIYDGGRPRRHDGANGRNTPLGFAIHTGASLWWALFFEALPKRSTGETLAHGAALSAGAYVIDYYVVPRRFRPGFEVALGPRSLFAVYAALAAGFCASAITRRARRRFPG